MDVIDNKILDILQRDARISMRQLANEIPMSVPAVYERVRKMEESGVIRGYGVKLDPTKAGRHINGYIAATFSAVPGYEFAERIRDDKRIVEIHGLAGKTTLMIRVSCRDMDDLNDLLFNRLAGVITETYIIVSELKPYGYEL